MSHIFFLLTVSAPKKEYTWNQIKKLISLRKKIIKRFFYTPLDEDTNSNLQCRNSSQTAGTYTVQHQMQWASVLSSSACIYLMEMEKMVSCAQFTFIQIHVHNYMWYHYFTKNQYILKVYFYYKEKLIQYFNVVMSSGNYLKMVF